MSAKDYKDATLWGVRAGNADQAAHIFLKQHEIALGWERISDLATIPKNRDAIKERVQQAYPNEKAGYYPVAAGQLFRFVHEMKEKDLVVYPCKQDRRIYIGEVAGAYHHVGKSADGYPHRRPVKWLKDVPRTRFSQGALYELGSALTIFQVRNFADEFLAVLCDGPIGPPDPGPLPPEEIEQNTKDFVLKTLATELKGHAFADFVAHLLGTMGYQTRVSAPGPDRGVDIIAHRDELGFVPPIIKVQVKSTEGNVGDPVVAQLIGKLEHGEYGMIVTLGSFTPQALATSSSKSNLRLIDGDDLVDLVLQHYEAFDSRYKGILPLKRVYVPQPLQEPEA